MIGYLIANHQREQAITVRSGISTQYIADNNAVIGEEDRKRPGKI